MVSSTPCWAISISRRQCRSVKRASWAPPRLAAAGAAVWVPSTVYFRATPPSPSSRGGLCWLRRPPSPACCRGYVGSDTSYSCTNTDRKTFSHTSVFTESTERPMTNQITAGKREPRLLIFGWLPGADEVRLVAHPLPEFDKGIIAYMTAASSESV